MALGAVVLLGLVAIPSFAAHGGGNGHDTYRIIAAPGVVSPGHPVLMIVFLHHASPSCAYAVTITVTGPGGVSAQDQFTVNSQRQGNGIGIALFPDQFTGLASTMNPGLYHVSASFQCQYTYVSGAASTTFVVSAHHHDG